MEQNRIGIIGLGLIGGSLAKALHKKTGAEIFAMDRSLPVLHEAQADGVVAKGFQLPRDFLASAEVYSVLEGCAVIFICLPLKLIPPVAELVGQACSGIITDVGSVKQPIIENIQQEAFIGGHPMAGSERQGYACGTASLFENAIYVLCPQDHQREEVEILAGWIEKIGAIPLVMAAHEHDQLVAAVSHLPHVVAAALVRTVLAGQQSRAMQLAAGGFRDITRIASSDPHLWAEISTQSRAYLLPLIERQIEELKEFASLLETGDVNGLHTRFSQAADLRDSLPEGGSGALITGGTFAVEVADRPGVLGSIAALLGEEQINIRNMSIRNARQYEGGQLQIWLYDAHLVPRARAVLEKAGYRCQ